MKKKGKKKGEKIEKDIAMDNFLNSLAMVLINKARANLKSKPVQARRRERQGLISRRGLLGGKLRSVIPFSCLWVCR